MTSEKPASKIYINRIYLLSLSQLLMLSSRNGGFSEASCLISSVVKRPRMAGPREKLYLPSKYLYQVLIAAESFILFPARGCMLCILAATTLLKFSVLSKDSKKTDNLAASNKWSGQ